MPEGDTIGKLARRITERFAGAEVVSSITRDPRLVGADFAGRRLMEAVSAGKYLLIRFDDETTLHSHLRMDGEWIVGPVARRPSWQRRVELFFEDGRLTAIEIPTIGVVATADESSIIGHLGPDLCGPEAPDPELVAARLAAEGDRPLAAALLDQRVVAGFGNVFAVEIPFLLGVSPHAPVDDVEHLTDLVRVGTALIRWSVAGNARNTTGRRLQRDEHQIYGGGSGRCPVCGEQLQHVGADDSPWQRVSWWCPHCQPGAVADIARARRLLALHPARRQFADVS